ncbi:MAG TPA: hypothetical protein VGE52_09135, partial [Pirellulales bacterium]
FSDFTSETGPLDLDELRGFAVKALPDDVKPSEIVCGAFRGFYGEYVDDEAFWRQWWLSTGERHLFVTYHSDPEERDAHAAVVDWMLGSLSLAEEAGAEDEK